MGIGVIRKIGSAGQVWIPMDMRHILDIQHNTAVEMYLDGRAIALQRHRLLCMLCSQGADVSEYRGKQVCQQCRHELSMVMSPYSRSAG